MVVFPLKAFILSVSLVALAAVATTAQTTHPPPLTSPASALSLPTTPTAAHDACGILGTSPDSEITYEKVAACYKSVPFNSKIAATTLESIITIFDDFYTFRDSALTPKLTKPFSAGPVDILKKLETIGRTKYTSDHQYHHDLSLAIISLKDAHARYAGEYLVVVV
jgi:hypothetical protein